MLLQVSEFVAGCRFVKNKNQECQNVVSVKCGASAGLAAFEIPLAYIRRDKFNQPIFACNNLSGRWYDSC